MFQKVSLSNPIFGWARLGELSGNVLFEGTLAWEEGTHAARLMIHTAGPNLEKWCQLRIEPYHGRIAVERYDQINGDQMYLDERRIRFDKNEAKVQLIVSGNILLAYVNDILFIPGQMMIYRMIITMMTALPCALCTVFICRIRSVFSRI